MLLKILALAALAAVIWWMTRPSPAVGNVDDGGKADDDGNTAMVQCGKCGVYHAADVSCDCKK